MTGPSTAEREAQELLEATDAATLLRKSHQLTHRMHDRENGFTDGRGFAANETAADIRAQRDLIDAELLRRCGEHR